MTSRKERTVTGEQGTKHFELNIKISKTKDSWSPLRLLKKNVDRIILNNKCDKLLRIIKNQSKDWK